MKSFFENVLAAAAQAAFDWVKNMITAVLAEVMALFKAVCAPALAIAENVAATFNVAPPEVIHAQLT